jgi:hypothetical protein
MRNRSYSQNIRRDAVLNKAKAHTCSVWYMLIGLSVLIVYLPAATAKADAAEQNLYKLPWKMIAEEFDAKKPFCATESEDGKTINFALAPDTPIIKLPPNIKMPEEQTEAELNLSVWQQDRWAVLPPLTGRIGPNGMTTNDNAISEGFYSLSVTCNKNDIGKENTFYAVISKDWEKEMLRWCRKNKEQIETNPDTELICSSIASSHFDNLMELSGKSQPLSENILSALSKAIKAKADFEGGNCPELVKGLNKIRLRRFEGSTTEEFVVFIPETYKRTKPEAVFLYPDNQRWAARDNYAPPSGLIDIWWHTVNDKDINWKSFEYFFNTLKQKLNIDENRVYVSGDCGNGLAAMSLALKYPDQWAQCIIALGNTYRHLAGNALNLPLLFARGNHYDYCLISYYNFAVECFRYYGCRFFKPVEAASAASARENSLPTATRNLSPYRVFYTIESLANPRAYWVQIDGREDENFIASIDAIVWGQSILVKTDNVDAYALNLKQAPLDCNRPVEVIENNEYPDSVTGPVFVRKSPKYENVPYIKNKSLHGPVSDIFSDRYAVVWRGDENLERFARQLAGSGPCFEEANLPADFINTHNIIFVGRPDKSKYLAQITDKLPVIIEDGRLTANSRVYEGDFGVIFVYPNPLNAEKYLAIFTGSTDKSLNLLNSAWEQIKSKDNADIGVFEVSEKNMINWLICEKFNTVWNWHNSWDVPLAKPAETHPKWQWCQWVAKVLREQLNADLIISEEPFASMELPGTGELTFRDISRVFKNDWIVKITLKGKDIRELLTVPLKDIPYTRVPATVIDGVSLVKQISNSNIFCISELENNKEYTVAFAYKGVNGDRMGMVLKDYKVVGDGFLVALLRDYLSRNKNLDIDNQLNSLSSNVF